MTYIPVAYRYKKPVVNDAGVLVGYSGWIITDKIDWLEWWPNEVLFSIEN